MKSIDLRAASLSAFTYNHKWYYTSLGDFSLRSDTYKNCVESMLPAAWEMREGSIWFMVNEKNCTFLPYGFKIHVSVLPWEVEKALQKILPVLFQRKAAFKIPRDHTLHDFLNSASATRGSAGKFMTIYPHSLAEFKILIGLLDAVTKDFEGPFILTDKRYRDSKCLFYRYGTFVSKAKLNILGQKDIDLIGPESTPDSRQPWFQLPPGVEDPFPTPPEEQGSPLLHGRYAIEEALAPHSTKGGVYLAMDTATGEKVVVKESRPHINASLKRPQDAVAGLVHEEHILKRIGHLGIAPKFIDSFQEWEHHFLVMEYIPLKNLRNYARDEANNPFIEPESSREDQIRFVRRSATILSQLLLTIQTLHDAGIVMGDLAPQNILYDPLTLEVKLIDFEGAYDQREDVFFKGLLTPGFTVFPPDKPQFSNDLQAVANMAIHLLLPMCQFFPLHPTGKVQFLEGLLRERNLPLELKTFFMSLPENPEGALAALDGLVSQSPTSWNCSPGFAADERLDLEGSVQKIIAYYHSDLKQEIRNAIFPGDYRLFGTNPLGIAFGAWGVGGFFDSVGENLPAEKLERMLQLSENIGNSKYPPGLYMGTSGIAWMMHRMGYDDLAYQTISHTFNSPLRFKSADFFQGAAGWGLAALYFYGVSADPSFLEQANEAASYISEQLKRNEKGLYFEQEGGYTYSGLMHGAAGIALFFTHLFRFSQNPAHKSTAVDLMAFELAHSAEGKNQGLWKRSHEEENLFPYMRFGSAGIGMALLRMHATFGMPIHLQWAKKVAHALSDKCALQPGLFLGMAGIGEFFIDLYQVTGEQNYIQEARAYARRTLRYQVPGEHGIAFPGDMLMRLSLDYGTGSAGIGMFLHRLQHASEKGLLFLDLDDSKALGKPSTAHAAMQTTANRT